MSTILHLDFRKIAPDYDQVLLTIRDRFGCETRWMLPADAGKEAVETAVQKHIGYSQASTARN